MTRLKWITSVFARATCSDKDSDTLLHGRGYQDSVAAVRCVNTQSTVVKMIPDNLCTVKSGILVEGVSLILTVIHKTRRKTA